MLPPSPLTDPDVQISRIRFLQEMFAHGGVSVEDPSHLPQFLRRKIVLPDGDTDIFCLGSRLAE
jgi:hypothetical protein